MTVEKRVPELLDEARLEGVIAIERLLGPPLEAVLVDRESLDDAVLAIEQCCQRWAGALYPLVPGTRDDMGLVSPWDTYLGQCDVEWVCSRNLLQHDGVVMNFFAHTLREGVPGGEFILKVLHARRESPESYKPVDSARPCVDDPWFVAYAGCLGLLAGDPDPEQLRGNGFLPGLPFSDFIRVNSQEVESPSADDLLERVQSRSTLPPTSLSRLGLGVGHAPRNMSLVEVDPIFPHQARLAETVGPNVVVVYEPGSVEDLCLIWDLRAAHGLPAGYPLAVPITADVAAAIDIWKAGSAQTEWQLRAPRLFLASASVADARLRAIAESVPGIDGVATLDEILLPPTMPGQVSTDVTTFVDGQATAAAWSAADREAFPLAPRPMDWYGFKVRTRPRNKILPPSKWMQRRSGVMGGPAGGYWETSASRPGDIARISWPSGWTVIASLAHDRGLVAKPSPAGRAAASFLRRFGSIDALGPLLDAKLVADLHRLCEREGMSWFRNELRRIKEQLRATDKASAALSRKIDDLVVSRRESEDGQFLTYSGLKNSGVFEDKSLAGRWLTWAEGAGLIVRGVNVACDGCGAKSWRAMGELSTTLTCRGCGNVIARPYPADQLVFHYRASELLVQVTRWDALVHLLTMRYFCELFSETPDSPSRLYGAYPGVDFYSEETGSHLGEADVVLVFATGEVALGECKRSAMGLKDADIRKLDRLAAEMGAEWSFLATLAMAADCTPIWRESERRLPDTPRFVLTGDHLMQRHVFWALGDDPFAWPDTDPAGPDPEPTPAWSHEMFDWFDGGGGWDSWIASE